MSTWEFNEVRQAIENKLRTELPPEQAHATADLAVSAFYTFTSGYDLIETTQLGSVDETAIKQRYIDARIYYGGVENLRRPRRTGGDGWQPVLLDVSRDPQRHPRGPDGRYVATCREMPTRRCPAAYGGPCGDRPCARFESEDPAVWAAEAAETKRRYVAEGKTGQFIERGERG